MTLTKAKLIDELSLKLGIEERKAKELIEIFFEEIISVLESGHHLHLSSFGNFKLLDKKERPGRNPKTGEEVLITSRRVMTFRAGEKLRNRINKHMELIATSKI